MHFQAAESPVNTSTSAVWVSVLHAAQQPFRSFGELADDVRRRLDLLHGTHRLPGVVGHGLDLAGAPAGRRRRHEARQGCQMPN
jgi:hypothetical protein